VFRPRLEILEDRTLLSGSSPTSQVGALAARQTTNTFLVPVNYSEPADGTTTAGVASVDLYVADNGGAFALYQTLTANGAASGTLSFSFTGSDRHTYAFHSLAHDLAGNTENKSDTLIEASTFVPDLNPPVTHVLAASPGYSCLPFRNSCRFSRLIL
jgi:hypothetical protein